MAEEYEERGVPVHPSQSRRAGHNLSAAGVPILGGGMSGGLYVIVVAVPVGAPTPDWRQAPPSQPARAWALPAFNWRVFVQILCALAIVGGIAYFAWGMMGGGAGGGAGEEPGMSWDDVGAWLDARAAALRPLPRGEPVVETTEWRWPWESAVISGPKSADAGGWSWPPANPVGDALDGAAAAVTWLVWGLLAVGGLWLASLAFGIARRMRG